MIFPSMMSYKIAVICQGNPASFPFWKETLSIFLGDVFAVLFIGAAAAVLAYLVKHPGFRVGANWSYIGWDVAKMGRLPNDTDKGDVQFMPNIAVTSYDMS